MNFNPVEAKRLADMLLDTDPGLGEEEAGEPAAVGRLSPGPFGRYRITRLVGIGGMGEVYEAQQESPARIVAIKVVRPDLISGEALRRFEHETRILGRLQHPGIAPIFEAGQVETGSGRTPFFAMEFVDGKPLTAFVAEGKLPLRKRLGLFLEVCEAVEHAHRKGVIHRDLKPGNLLVGTDGRPRVMDFGVARATDSDVRATSMGTEIGRLVGTLPYMSPEQVGGDPDALDTRSDVYSLGVVLYELLAGRLPYDFRGEGRGKIPEAVRAIQESEPAPLSSIDRVFRGDLDTITAKALAKERGQRYQSVGELAADIRRYLADEPIVARRPSAWYQFRKFTVRNPLPVAAGALSLMLITAGVVAGVLYAAHEGRIVAELTKSRAEQQKALSLAEKRREEAERNAARARSALGFIQQALSAAQPGKLGPEARVLDMLGQAAKSVGAEMGDDPSAEAAVRAAIGDLYESLGEHSRAEEQFRLALDLNRTALGPDDLETIGARVRLARAIVGAGRYADARIEAEAAVEQSRRVLGEDDQGTLVAMGDLATIYCALDELPLARAMTEHCLARQTALQGERHPKTLGQLGNLAAILDKQGEWARAEEMYRLATRLQSEVRGADDPNAIAFRANLCDILRREEKFEEALPLARAVLDSKRRVFGPEHPDTVISLSHLALVLQDLERYDEALPLLRQTVELRTRLLGADHPDTLTAMNNVATVLADTGDHAGALDIVGKVAEAQERSLGLRHPKTIAAMINLAASLHELSRDDEAERIYKRLLEANDGAPGEGLLPHAKYGYGVQLLQLGRYPEAEQQLIAANKAFRERGHPRFRGTCRALIDLYTRWGKPDRAAEFRALLPADDRAAEPPK